MAISGYLYRVSSIKVQVEAGESNLLQFETFSLFYYFFSYERVLEELSLLKKAVKEPIFFNPSLDILNISVFEHINNKPVCSNSTCDSRHGHHSGGHHLQPGGGGGHQGDARHDL